LLNKGLGYKGLGKPSGDTTVIYQSTRQNPLTTTHTPYLLKYSYESDKFSKNNLKFTIIRYILINEYVPLIMIW
jgi:hypothetical protein